MKLVKPHEGKVLPFAFFAVKRFDKNNIEVVELVLKENQVIDLHSLSCKVIFFVKSGNGYFLSDKGRTKVEKGTIIYVEPNELRGWFCEKDQEISLWVVKIME